MKNRDSMRPTRQASIRRPQRVARVRPRPIAAACFWIVATAIACTALPAGAKEPVECVDPMIDSANSRWIFFASACRPFGMVNLSPDTDVKGWWNSGYCYHTPTICGLGHVHAWQLSGPSVMPLCGEIRLQTGSDFCRSKFDHQSELALLFLTTFWSFQREFSLSGLKDANAAGFRHGN